MAVTGTTFSTKTGTANTTELRALGTQINAAVASAGLVQTTDTGQVNWATINWATGAQAWGYEVWRFNDALQATHPVFVRITYAQPSSPLALNITAAVGTATDGAGNLTAAPNTNSSVTGAVAICSVGSSSPITAVKPWYVYGDGSSLIIASTPEYMAAASSGQGGLFILERARHTDGTPLGDGVALLWISGTLPTPSAQSLLIHNLTPQLGGFANVGWLPAVTSAATPTSGVLATNMHVLPYFTGFTPRLGAPSTMVVGIMKADMPTGNSFPLTHYGENGTFVAISPPGAYPMSMAGSSVTLHGVAVRVS